MIAHARVARRRAFALMDLLMVLFIIAVLASLLLPALGRAKAQGRRIHCTSNLKQVTLAFRLFADENEEKFPWLVLARDGGSADDLWQEAASHFRVLSNGLETPKLLLCPSDRARQMGERWAALTNANVSYFVGLEGDELRPESMVAGDRNLSGAYNSTPCPALNAVWAGLGLTRMPMGSTIDQNSTWTSALHNAAGNVSLSDGSVHYLNSQQLRRQTMDSDPFNNNNHARIPD